jgi:hypothetical protein
MVRERAAAKQNAATALRVRIIIVVIVVSPSIGTCCVERCYCSGRSWYLHVVGLGLGYLLTKSDMR